jgi:hypothetical protein
MLAQNSARGGSLQERGPNMLSQLEYFEGLAGWRSRVSSEQISIAPASKRTFTLPRIEPAMALPAGIEMESWLIRSGLSPKASFPVSQIGLYTDFA